MEAFFLIRKCVVSVYKITKVPSISQFGNKVLIRLQ